jgi:hypothetical protein
VVSVRTYKPALRDEKTILRKVTTGSGLRLIHARRLIFMTPSGFRQSVQAQWAARHGCGHGAVSGIFCDATNQELSKRSCAKPRYPARHQYGLQIAKGMVTFFESYEREPEKYWTKTLFFQLS